MHGPFPTKFSFHICLREEAPVPEAGAVSFELMLVYNGAKLKFADCFFIIPFAELAKERDLISQGFSTKFEKSICNLWYECALKLFVD